MNYSVEHEDKTKIPSPSGDFVSSLDLVLLQDSLSAEELQIDENSLTGLKSNQHLPWEGSRRSAEEHDGFYHLKW